MSIDNPWRKTGSRIVYKNNWITVREDQVINPNGAPSIYGVVEARAATGVVALTDDNMTYLVGQYRYPVEEYSWEIPEGGAEDGETPLEAAKRELEEETGIIADSWTQLGGEVHLSNCFTSEKAYFFLARDLKEGQNAPDETEILKVHKVPFDKALAMVDSGEIRDAMTIIAILRTARFIKR